jgi:putative NADH-flavin reductase
MNITIFGATGQIGQHLTKQSLDAGHQVTAFTRSPDKMQHSHKNLHIIHGDVLDLPAVTQATKGSDAVFCALGMPLMNKEGLRAKGTRNIVQAMTDTGVKRLICLSVFGANDSRTLLPLTYKALIVPLILRHIMADHEKQETYVTNSTLNWTLVRPGNFTKGGFTGSYRHGFTTSDKPSKIKISQPDLADFMFKQLGSDDYLKQAPCISY